MSEAAHAAPRPQAAPNRMIELKVSAHLMALEPGIFCIFQQPGSPTAGPDGLPGIRVSLPPGQARPDAVVISTFRQDGWLNGGDGAALVRVNHGPAQVLVTIYQAPGSAAEMAPRLQVLRLGSEASPAPAATAVPTQISPDAEIVAHVQRTGDVGGKLGDWIGTRGSRLWIEGFGVNPRGEIEPDQIEYQAVLGRGWLSPWIEGGKFCGSRGMALPLLGLRVRLKDPTAATHDLAVEASFVDGSKAGPVSAGEACESESLAALEAFQITLRPRQSKPSAASGTRPVAPRKTGRRTR